ncbi:MAG: GTPase domain-containing protein [Thermoplasmataceae archaeon]|jgi:GTPase SAR1 family protein
MDSTRVVWKVSVIGPDGSGKSSLISRIIYDSDSTGIQSKSILKKSLSISDHGKKILADLLFLEIDPSNGDDKLVVGSNALIVTVDLTNQSTLSEAEKILKMINKAGSKSFILLVANKLDRKYEASFWTEDLDAISRKYDVPYLVASAKNGEGIEELTKILTDQLLKRFLKKRLNA